MAIGGDVFELATEIEGPGHPRGQEKLGMPLLGRIDVYVHVDEPWHQELPAPIDDLGSGWDGGGGHRTHGREAPALDDYDAPGKRRPRRPVDERGAGDGEDEPGGCHEIPGASSLARSGRRRADGAVTRRGC